MGELLNLLSQSPIFFCLILFISICGYRALFKWLHIKFKNSNKKWKNKLKEWENG